MTSHSEGRRGPRPPLLLVPLLTYIGVTVVAPLVNGAARRDGFWVHALLDVAISSLLTCGWMGLARLRGRRS